MSCPFSETLERARNGDAGAVEELLIPHLAGLTAFVRLRLPLRMRQRESSADVVQSIFREAIDDLDRVEARDEVGFKAWLFGMAVHKLAHKRKTRGRPSTCSSRRTARSIRGRRHASRRTVTSS